MHEARLRHKIKKSRNRENVGYEVIVVSRRYSF